MLDSFFNAIFGWAINISPLVGILIISIILTLLVTLVYKFMTDQIAIKGLKDEMKSMRQEMKDNKHDQKKMMEIQKRSMEKSLQQMKHTLKPMLITMLPLLIIFSWLRNTYNPIGPILWGMTWIWIYIISSIVFSITLRKIMKVH